MTDRIRTEFEKWATGREFPDLTQSMSREAILRRNIADMEVALRAQSERAEAAEAELEKLAQQKPVAWMHDKDGRVDTCHDSVKEMWIKVGQKQNTPFMREMVPCRVEHYNIPLYAVPIPAPAVPAVPTDEQIHTTYRKALGQSIRERDMPEIRKFARALLQSTEQTK